MIDFISPGLGSHPGRLVAYLFGPGRFNEHSDPHVIAAVDLLGLPDGHRFTDEGALRDFGLELDAHREAMDIPIPANGHIWHCSIAIPATDQSLGDAEWAQIARAAVDELAFTEGPGRDPCRWVAVRHGVSTGGNDHIHLMVNTIREDGSTASLSHDWRIMSQLCAHFEQRFGLQVVEGRIHGGMPGLTRGELERGAREGRREPVRRELARRVRACAVSAADEADFVRRLRGHGLAVRARRDLVTGRNVVGYTVALRQDRKGFGHDAEPRWFAGGSLARDLTLNRLRARWRSGMESGVTAWTAPEPEAPMLPDPDDVALSWPQARQIIAAFSARLAREVGDHGARAEAAWWISGMLAARSTTAELRQAGPLAAAADTLAGLAQTRAGAGAGPDPNLRGVARMLADPDAGLERTALLPELIGAMEILRDAVPAVGRQQRASALAADIAALRAGDCR